MSEYMRMILGYCFTGEMGSRAFFIWYGNLGKNGKSTVCLIMAAILDPLIDTLLSETRTCSRCKKYRWFCDFTHGAIDVC